MKVQTILLGDTAIPKFDQTTHLFPTERCLPTSAHPRTSVSSKRSIGATRGSPKRIPSSWSNAPAGWNVALTDQAVFLRDTTLKQCWKTSNSSLYTYKLYTHFQPNLSVMSSNISTKRQNKSIHLHPNPLMHPSICDECKGITMTTGTQLWLPYTGAYLSIGKRANRDPKDPKDSKRTQLTVNGMIHSCSYPHVPGIRASLEIIW